jgi:hypothetical protein
METSTKQRWNRCDKGKAKYLEKALSLSHYVHHMLPVDFSLIHANGKDRTYKSMLYIFQFSLPSPTVKVIIWVSLLYLYYKILRDFLAVMYAFDYSRLLDTNSSYSKKNRTKKKLFFFFTKLNL